MTACTRTGSGASQGRVIVTASDNVDTWFAPVIGKGDYTVSSTSTAQWGPPSAVSGLRPLGLCAFGDATLEGLVTNPKAFGSTPVTLHISYDKDQAKDCGTNVPGNWGMINFDGKSGNTSAQSTIIKDGFPGLVNIGNDQTGSSKSCPSSEIHCYPGDTGALAGLDAAFTTLKTSGIWFTIPVFDFAVGNGANAKFHLMGVLRVQLVDFDTNGSQSGSSSSSSSKSSGKKDDDDDDDDDDDGPFFEFKVQPGLITGTCCGPASGTGNNRVLALCAVDPKSSGSCSA